MRGRRARSLPPGGTLTGFCRCGEPTAQAPGPDRAVSSREACRDAGHPPFDWSRTAEDPCPEILDLVLALHCAYTGACDPLPQEEEKRIRRVLLSRLLFWQGSLTFTTAFDEAVKGLIQAALAENR